MQKICQILAKGLGTSLRTGFQQLITHLEIENQGKRLIVFYIVLCKLFNDASNFCKKKNKT